MIVTISKWILFLFGTYIILIGFLILFAPKKARTILRKAGSTNFINYAEITIRLIPAFALIHYADYSKFPLEFTIFGWIMVITSMVLYIIPRKWHHQFSMKSADLLLPFYIQLIAPIAFLLGGLIIYATL